MIPFRPVIEPVHPGAFLTGEPAFLTKHGQLLDIPWMTGLTSQEGALKAPGNTMYSFKAEPHQTI